MQEIPTDFREICTLESIELHDCSTTAEDSARNIEQEQDEMGNNSLKVYIHKSHKSLISHFESVFLCSCTKKYVFFIELHNCDTTVEDSARNIAQEQEAEQSGE
ncbi:hypothetical protein R3W88_011172 [Solanum pinnatisectum]|uniref:Uncharacterized protein n=1 Tax=Solanum pinnatisectum TaxID=50273 RepID=A0AAV9L5U1_9SOLN|nr:hypothetical protein R3W88_011172 [Solanum pinnatisectum]